MGAVGAPQFDLLDHQLFAEREPWDVFEWLQREAPVYRHPDEDDGFWCVTKYDDVLDVLKRPKVFSSGRGGSAALTSPPPAQISQDISRSREAGAGPWRRRKD